MIKNRNGFGKWNTIADHKFLLIVAGWIIFFIFFACLLPISFEENDDVAMLLFASGKYSGVPQSHLVFINYAYGSVLTFLYSFVKGIEWYSVLFAFVHVVALSVISWKIISTKNVKAGYKILFISLLCVLEIRFILYFQFTTTAALGALAGIGLISCEKFYQQSLGILLFLIAGLIRFEAAMLVLIIASPVLIRSIIVHNVPTFSKQVVILIIAILLLSLFKYADFRSYQKEENWKYYTEYNRLRGAINDNPNAGAIKNDLPADISVQDYTLLLTFFPDAKFLDLQKINLLHTKLKHIGITKKLGNVFPSLLVHKYYLILLMLCWTLIFFYSKNKINRWMLICTFFAFFSALVYVSLEGAVKYRVFITAVLPLLYVMYISAENKISLKYNPVLVIVLCSFILLISKQNYGLWNLRKEARITLFSQQKTILEKYLKPAGNSIVVFGGDLTVQLYPPFKISKIFKEKKIFFSGWVSNIPYNKTSFESYLDLINRHAVFFEKNNFRNMLPVIQENIFSNYGIAVLPEVKLESEDYVIVKLVSQH